MSRASSVSRLPDEIRDQINGLRTQGRTIDEIMLCLQTLDAKVSRSALGRYVKKQDQVAAQIRKSRELAEAVARTFGDRETSQVARTNMELLHSLMMKVMIGDDDSEAEVMIDAKEAMFLATALEKLSKSSKLDLDRELKVREEERKTATEKAAGAAVTAAKKQGLSAETVNNIRAAILGVDTKEAT